MKNRKNALGSQRTIQRTRPASLKYMGSASVLSVQSAPNPDLLEPIPNCVGQVSTPNPGPNAVQNDSLLDGRRTDVGEMRPPGLVGVNGRAEAFLKLWTARTDDHDGFLGGAQ